MRVVVTSGYARSLHAVGVLHGLAARGHTVGACLCVRMLSAARLRFYLRQLGPAKMLARARSRLVGGGGVSAEVAPMIEYLREHGVVSRGVRDACRAIGARVVAVKSLNDAGALAVLRQAQPDLVVYAGGGIVRKDFLSVPRLGILNAHGGPLPAFRGMNAAEWALYYGVRPTVAACLMDEGIDTGPVLFERPIPQEVFRTGRIDHLRGVATRVSVEALLDAADTLAAGSAKPVTQDSAAGRQFFVMAEPMVELVERWMADGRTPTVDARDFRFPERGVGVALASSR